MLRTFRVQLNRSTARECLLMRSPVNVIFCGDMQLLFCLQGRYMGTDISKTAFQYMDFVQSMKAAHPIDSMRMSAGAT